MSSSPQIAAAEPTPAADARPAAKARGQDTLIQCIDQWPEHPTWKRWLFRVWDKRTRQRISESFPDGEKAKGWEWAEHQRALLNQGRTSAGPVLFEAVGARFVQDLERIGRKASHIAEYQRLVAAVVAAGAVNMRDEGFARKVADWIATARCFHQGAAKRLAAAQERFAGAAQRHREALANAQAPGDARHPRVAAIRLAKAERRLQAEQRRLDRELAAAADARQPNAKTKNRWLVMLKSVAKSARQFGVLDNPLTPIRPFKEDDTVKTALRVDELRAMVSDDRAGDDYFRQACTLVYGGVRTDEAAHIRKEWIDREAGTIHIRVIRDAKGKVVWAPKGNKERVIPILAEYGELLDRWLADDVAAGGSATSGWLISAAGLRRLEDKGHWLAFREYLGRCGIDAAARDLSPHCTRHTWTAIRLATGVSPNRLRRQLGHKKLETTDIYAEGEALFEKVVKDWPRGELCLRRRPGASATAAGGFLLDCDRDPREVLDLFVARGGRLDHLAATAGVPAAVLRTWMIDGIPDAVQQYLAVMAASARLAAAAAATKPQPLIAATQALAAPLTATTKTS
jgi:integrase